MPVRRKPARQSRKNVTVTRSFWGPIAKLPFCACEAQTSSSIGEKCYCYSLLLGPDSQAGLRQRFAKPSVGGSNPPRAYLSPPQSHSSKMLFFLRQRFAPRYRPLLLAQKGALVSRRFESASGLSFSFLPFLRGTLPAAAHMLRMQKG